MTGAKEAGRSDGKLKEEAMAAIVAVLAFFRVHGRSRERFGDTLQRTGFPALETFVKEGVGRP